MPHEVPTLPPVAIRNVPDTGASRGLKIGDMVTWGSRVLSLEVVSILHNGVRVSLAPGVTHFVTYEGNAQGPLVHANGDEISYDNLAAEDVMPSPARTARTARIARALFATDPEVISFVRTRAEAERSDEKYVDTFPASQRINRVEDLAWSRGVSGLAPEAEWVERACSRAAILTDHLGE